MSGTRHWRAACALGLGILLTGCTSGGDLGSPPRGSTPPPPSHSTTASSSASASPSGGTPQDPLVVTPTTQLLDWTAVPGSTDDTATVSGLWTLTIDRSRSRATLAGPRSQIFPAGRRGRITEALIDQEYAVVVVGDRLEQRPGRAFVIRLTDGQRRVLDGDTDVPTVNGGTWALGHGHLLHATTGPARAYCLASVDLASTSSSVLWCAPPGSGFNGARVTAEGDAMLTFDDQHPSCRTVVSVDGDQVAAFPGVEACAGWEGALLPGGRIWSVIPNERHIAEAHFYASRGGDYYDLGPGLSGSLTVCGGAAYFGRDPGRDGGPARVLRWTADGTLAVVYQTAPGGQAVLGGPPRCGGDHLTVTGLTEAGDEQVTTPLL